MKKYLLLALLLGCTSMIGSAQILVGDMNSDGTVDVSDVTNIVSIILGNTPDYDSRRADVNRDGDISVSDITALVNIILGNAEPILLNEADSLFIHYTDSEVTYELPQAWKDYVTVTVDGTHVEVYNSNTVAEYVTVLSGSCSNGSYTYSGSFKTTLVLKGVSITNPSGSAINLLCGKRVSLELAEETQNVLVDGAEGSQKAALYCKGHLEISGSGTLTVQGNTKHAISAKEYIELKKSTGAITVSGALGDGIHAGQYFEMKGGTVTMTQVEGDGIQAEALREGDEQDGQLLIKGGTIDISLTGSDAAGLKCDSLMTVSGGTITVVSTGDDVKALKSDGNIVISDGTVLATQSGGYLVDTLDGNDGTTCDPSYTTAVKADSILIVTGGVITVNNTAAGGRGLNATKGIHIEGGECYIHANGEGGVVDRSSSGSEPSKSYRLYVSLPASTGGMYPGSQQSAWRNVYLYDSSGSLVASLGNQQSFTVNGTTTTFYYYDFGAPTSGTYYLMSDNYSSGGGMGGGTTYTIRSANITLDLTGSDVFYSISSRYSTSGSTRTYSISNVTSDYAGASSATQEGETYKAFCLKSDADISVSGGMLLLTHSGTMSKGIKADGTVAVSGGSIDDTAGGRYMIVGTDPVYSTSVKCTTYEGTDGEVTLAGTGSASHGISADGTLTIAGGVYDITLSGDGATYTGNGETEGCGARGLKSDGDMLLLGGTVTINSSASGGKGIKVGTSKVSGVSGARLTVGNASTAGQGPSLVVSTTGSYLATESSGGNFGGGPMEEGFIGSAKAVKCMGAVVVYGGDIRLSTTTNGAEGLESKSTITFNGGTFESDSYDDAINAASTITFNDGNVWAHASNNDAVDSNDSSTGIVINGGVVIASGSSSPEEGFDCDNAAFVLNGGMVIGTGGSQGGGGGSGGLPTKATQPYVSMSSTSLSAGTYLSLKGSNGTVLCSYRIPRSVSSATVLMSSPSLSTGSSVTMVYNGTSVSNPSSTLWNGVYTIGATLTGGTSKTLSPVTK